MKTFTFIKRLASVLLTVALLFPAFAYAQKTGTSDFLTKSKKKSKLELTQKQGVKMTPHMKQMIRDVKKPQSLPSATNLTKPSPKTKNRMPLAVTESGATLYGNLIYSYAMTDMSSVGFYSIDPNTGEYVPIGTNEQLAGAGTVVDGIAYISYAESFFGMILGLYTIAYDIESAAIIDIAEHSPEDFTSYAVNMSYNPVDDMIYAMTYDESGYYSALSQFDRTTFVYTPIATLYLPSDVFAMAFDPNGNLYIICADGIVREISTTTGEVIREVCNTGFLPEYMQSACWSPKDGKILWAASNETESYIMSIDLTSGTTETLCSFDLYEEWTSLYTSDPLADENAPAAPVVQYNANAAGSLLGNIIIETPTLNIAGGTLASTAYTLVIELNGTEIYNNQVTPGENVSLNDVEFAEGMNNIRAYAINDAGKGDVGSLKIYAGEDTPLAVTNLEVNIDDNGQASLSWTAPTEGENGGYLNTANLTYTIERSGVTVATGITNTYYIDQLPNELASYEWLVYAVSGNKTSKPASTGKFMFGNSLSLPYEQTFNNDACLDIYTIVNNNNDDRTWEYDATKEALLYLYSSYNDADDYAFTPLLKLNGGSIMLLEINACSYLTSYPENIEITLGKTTNPNEQTVIIPDTQLDWDTPKVLRTYFSVEESGDYFIGIHATSLADSYYLIVKDIKVTEGPASDAPAAVSNVTATAGDNGALTATITFTAPTESLGGTALTEDVTVTAYRNDEVVGTTTIAPGATGHIIDNNAQNGFNNYVLVTSNSYGEGDIYEISCRCGLDTPPLLSNIKFTTAESNLSTVMSWDVPTVGAEGGYINPDELVYNIYVPTADGYDVVWIAETTEPFYEITVEDKTLQGYTFYVSAQNEVGESNLYGGSVVLGSPYTLPFAEKIENLNLMSSPWFIIDENPNSYVTWELGSVMEYYNLPEIVTAPDGGMLVCYDFYEFSGGVCSLIAPKISLIGETDPTLYLSMYHYNTADYVNELSISITTDDNSYKKIFAKRVNDCETNGWVKYAVSLEEFIDAPWIGVSINAQISPDGFVFLDYITVENAVEDDIAIESVSAPSKVAVGEEMEITAKVVNRGSNNASFNVSFYIDENEIATIENQELISNDDNEYRTKFTPTADNFGESEIKVVVTMNDATDLVEKNNEATSKFTVTQPRLRVVTDLVAKKSDDNNATLTWSAPALAPEAIVDDIEQYESFIIDNIGNFTVVDADLTETYIIDGVNIPSGGEPKAWQVWAPAELGISTETWLPYDGNKCLIAFSTISGAANDWLISPEVAGGTDFSFWAAIPTTEYGAEKFEILYSTTNTDIESFQLLTQETKNTEAWQQYEYTLPNDAKYFAIRYISVDIFALLIDDITYSNVSGNVELEVLGYNIFKDGQKINDSYVTETTFETPLSADSDNKFNVTVVYNEGESLFSNTAYVGEVSIEDMNSNDVKVYGQDNYIRIENVANKMVSVYSIDGRVVCNMKAVDDNIMIPANLGVYIVKIDNAAVCKVLVR
ncbi:MAG: choice-of-anchor J domain-containing protein [Bacteroidales bacterium]|nr:choice-of-anchor J domain-containing protein [Bacteroidales bacterium]